MWIRKEDGSSQRGGGNIGTGIELSKSSVGWNQCKIKLISTQSKTEINPLLPKHLLSLIS